jgi:lipoprotein NlpI
LDGALADYNRAIEIDPKSGWFYRSRGYFRYNTRSFPDALADFHKALAFGHEHPDYTHYRIWLIRARLGEKDAATKELRDYLVARKTGKPDDWEVQIGRFLAGQLSEADFLKAGGNADKRVENEQHCEAWFYVGTVRLIAGDKAAAKDYFEKCLATGVKTFAEYTSAAAELKHLQEGK